MPTSSHAGIFSSLGDRILSAVTRKEPVIPEDGSSGTAQTMPVLKPEVVGEDIQTGDASSSGDTLSSTSGSLRFSTEELDIPLNDTISVYEVKKGDTVASVAKVYGVSKNTIIWANDIKGSTLTPGDTLVILPITGIKYTIKKDFNHVINRISFKPVI